MNARSRTAIFVELASVALISGEYCFASPSTKQSSGHEQVIEVDFCELVKSPLDHHDDLVRVSASLMLSGTFLYDLRCNDPDWWVSTTYDQDNLPDLSVWNAAMAGRPARLHLTVVGRFRAPMGAGYGHLGAYRQEITILEYESITQVSEHESSPTFDPGPGLLSESARRIEELVLQWNRAYISGDFQAISAILDNDYIWVADNEATKTKRTLTATAFSPVTRSGVSTAGVSVFPYGELGVAVVTIRHPGLDSVVQHTHVLRSTTDEWRFVFTSSDNKPKP